MRLEDELKDLSPRLRELRQRDAQGGMTTPPDYFEGLENEVFRQLDALGARRTAPAPTPRTAWWHILFTPRATLAFGLALLLLAAGGWWLWQQNAHTEDDFTPLAAVEISPEEAETYLLNNAQELEPELLAAHLPDEAELTPAHPESDPKNPDDLELRPEDLENMLDELSEEEIRTLF